MKALIRIAFVMTDVVAATVSANADGVTKPVA